MGFANSPEILILLIVDDNAPELLQEVAREQAARTASG
jgi:hypothetical protein